MTRKGNKFSRYSSKNIKNQNKKNLESQQSYRYKEKCGCGSGLIFGKCCYRSDHRVFNLSSYLDKLKNIKLKLHDKVLIRFLEDYKKIPEIRDFTDNLSDELMIPRFSQIISDILNGREMIETTGDTFASAIRFEALTIDWTLPRHEKPIFQEELQFYLRKALDRVQKCYNSISKSQFSFYEVTKVKKAEDSQRNTWVCIRDLFTKKEHILKDPLICSQLCIWDVIIGRLYRVAGFNLFSTSVFILNPDQQKTFNRILFMFWLKEKIARNPAILEEFESTYPNLQRDFSHKYASFSKGYFYNDQIYKLLKQNSPLLIEIKRLITQIAPKYPLIVKSPDQQDIIFAECAGELISNKIVGAVNVLRSDKKFFNEVIETDKSYNLSFDYLLPNVETLMDELINDDITPKKLVHLNKKEIVNKILERIRKIITFGATTIISNWSLEQKAEAMENINTGPKVRVGFVEIKRNIIRLVTYSKKSMEELWKHINTILKPFLGQLSFPIYSDILKRSQYESQYSDPKDYLTLMEKMQSEDETSLPIDELEYLPELNYDFEDDNEEKEEEESIELESRMIRNHLMKQWINSKIPLLGGKSPKESLNDINYIPSLIDLIKESENSDDKAGKFDSNHTYSTYLGIDVAQFDNKVK